MISPTVNQINSSLVNRLRRISIRSLGNLKLNYVYMQQKNLLSCSRFRTVTDKQLTSV